MIIKIMDSNKLFENKNSEISKIFDFINNTLQDKKFFLKSLEIDGVELYEGYYEYFIENINFIDEVKVNIQNVSQLVNDVICSSYNYIERGMPLIEKLSTSFRKRPTEESWNELDNLFSGIGWLLESYSNIDRYNNLNELVSNYYIWNEYVVEIEKLRLTLPDFFEAIKNKDSVLISDILVYEINPIFQVMLEKLNEINNKDVSIQDAN